MKDKVAYLFLLLLGACVSLCSCQNPGSPSSNVVAAQLAERRESRERSVELYEQGLCAHQAKNLDQAHQYLSKAVVADEGNLHAWMTLGMVEFERDNLFAAASAFERAARLEPARYEPHFNIGTILEFAGRYQEAIRAYERTLELAPDQVMVMENLARCYVRSNTNLRRAKELIDRALLSEQRPEWRRWLERQSLRLVNKREQES